MWISNATGHIFCIRQILEEKWEYSKAVHQLFTDFKKVYDSLTREVTYNNLIEFHIPIKLVRLIKMYLTETYEYRRVRIGKNLSDMFPIRNGLKQDALSPLIFNFVLVYDIRRVQVNQDCLKLNGTHQFLVYAYVYILERSVHTIKENAEALAMASKEIRIEVNADKTKYMVMSRDQNAGRTHSID